MKSIFKYPLEDKTEQSVLMPQGAQVLSVQVQDNKPMLYALVDDALPLRQVRVISVGTGRLAPPDIGRYVGTAMMDGGSSVWHIFVG